VTDDQIAAALRRLADPNEAAQELVARARAAGGSDNITVVVVDVVDDGGQALAASEAIADEPGHEPGHEAGHEPAPPAGASTEGGGGGGAATTVMFPAVRKRRRVTLRVVVFIVLLLAVIAAAVTAVVVYARDSYFVTLGPAGSAPPSPLATSGARPIIIDKGRPGGLLWFDPTLAERTPYLSSEVLPSRLPDLEHGRTEPSLGAARAYVANLVEEARQAGATSP
jgi:protein phosphatase